MKIAPRIGYNCHDTIMEEMAELVEACNNNGAEWKEAFRDHVNNYRWDVRLGVREKRENEPSERSEVNYKSWKSEFGEGKATR